MNCPICKSTVVVKRGKSNGKYNSKQRYYCKTCTQSFSTTGLKYKTYPPQIISTALKIYTAGQSLQEVSRHINKTFKVRTSKSTIHSWIHEFSDLCPIIPLRQHFVSEENVVFTKRFEHENLDYEFMYHRYKLNTLAKELFPGLYTYITRFEQGCPDVFFEVGKRCSQPLFKVTVDATSERNNLACKMAAFAVQAATGNRERHRLVEQFMVINDSATVACEVPVWYWEKQKDTGVTGHIDLVQIRNNRVYILDYKPAADQEKKAPWQLYHYAIALSFRTNISLQHMRCAWFDEHSYYEYRPSTATVNDHNI